MTGSFDPLSHVAADSDAGSAAVDELDADRPAADRVTAAASHLEGSSVPLQSVLVAYARREGRFHAGVPAAVERDLERLTAAATELGHDVDLQRILDWTRPSSRAEALEIAKRISETPRFSPQKRSGRLAAFLESVSSAGIDVSPADDLQVDSLTDSTVTFESASDEVDGSNGSDRAHKPNEAAEDAMNEDIEHHQGEESAASTDRQGSTDASIGSKPGAEHVAADGAGEGSHAPAGDGNARAEDGEASEFVWPAAEDQPDDVDPALRPTIRSADEDETNQSPNVDETNQSPNDDETNQSPNDDPSEPANQDDTRTDGRMDGAGTVGGEATAALIADGESSSPDHAEVPGIEGLDVLTNENAPAVRIVRGCEDDYPDARALTASLSATDTAIPDALASVTDGEPETDPDQRVAERPEPKP